MGDYSFWDDYWAEEELAWKLEREDNIELDKQSRQIAYEADIRRMYPMGLKEPLHKDDLKR